MAEALLLSPSFLFRAELGAAPVSATGATTLTPYEVATQLSYTLLDSTPDATLLDAAGSGALATSDGIAAQADRLLATDFGKQNITRIVAAWFHGDDLARQTKDPALLTGPRANVDQSVIEADLYGSLFTFVDGTLWRPGGKVVDLVGPSPFFATQILASLYGVPFTGTAPRSFTPIAPADAAGAGDAGILTQPAFLWAITPSGASPIVARGMVVRDDIVCGEAIPNPLGLHTSPEVRALLASQPTDMERSAYATATAPCQGCHTEIDPYGRVLQGFDAIGHSRVTVDGLPVDASADFSNAPPLAGKLTGPAALAQAMTAGGQFAGCAVQQMSSYTIGRAIPGGASICETRKLAGSFAGSDGTIATLFRQVALAPFVRTRGGATP